MRIITCGAYYIVNDNYYNIHNILKLLSCKSLNVKPYLGIVLQKYSTKFNAVIRSHSITNSGVGDGITVCIGKNLLHISYDDKVYVTNPFGGLTVLLYETDAAFTISFHMHNILYTNTNRIRKGVRRRGSNYIILYTKVFPQKFSLY